MKARIEATAFNGSRVLCNIDLFVEGLSFLHDESPDELLSENVRARVRKTVLELIGKALPDQKVNQLAYRLVSRGLEEMRANHLEPDPEQLTRQITKAILDNLLEHVGLDIDAQVDALRERREVFRSIYFGKEVAGVRQKVRRLVDLHGERKYAEVAELLCELQREELTVAEKELMIPISLDMELRRANCQMNELENCFLQYLKLHEKHPTLSKKGYFHMIRAMEDCRDMQAPRRLLEEFETKYPLSLLMPDERSHYNYHKARTEYGRGEFIGALELLDKAQQDVSDEPALEAAIETVAANILSDNLFFEPARKLVEKALHTRRQLGLVDTFESQGCLAGIEFKEGRFEEARAGFEEYARLAQKVPLSGDERNRLHNYLAKSAIMVGDTDSAQWHLKDAFEAGDRLGFSASLQLLLHLRNGLHDVLAGFFSRTLMLPENHRRYDNFALGWGYSFAAVSAFEQESWEDGVFHLGRAVDFFQRDLYFMEAAWILRHLWEYPLPDESLKLFGRVCSAEKVLDDFSAYVEKHRGLPDRSDVLLSEWGGTTMNVPKDRLERLLAELRALKSMKPGTQPELLNRLCLY